MRKGQKASIIAGIIAYIFFAIYWFLYSHVPESQISEGSRDFLLQHFLMITFFWIFPLLYPRILIVVEELRKKRFGRGIPDNAKTFGYTSVVVMAISILSLLSLLFLSYVISYMYNGILPVPKG
jgi:hypothetical protein